MTKPPIQVHLTRLLNLPDPVRLERFRRVPELGPAVLFFSGGTAIRKLSRRLIHYTHNSIHLITPFDSGGSSARLREEFDMLAVGDFRNRLMALADQTIRGNPEIYRLFSYRFPKSESNQLLHQRLHAMIAGKDSLIADIEDPLRKIIRNHLGYLAEKLSDSFDLRGASIGNLILTGGYLNNSRHIDPVIYLFTKLVESRGTVRPIVNENLHLAAELKNGRTVIGQHRITGYDAPQISSPVTRLFINKGLTQKDETECEIREKTRRLIATADLIVYPMGSYYTSLLATLLPRGVGAAIAANPAPKIYIPNAGRDPEQLGMSMQQTVSSLIETLKRYENCNCSAQDLLNYMVIDSSNADYSFPVQLDAIRNMGIDIIDMPLAGTDTSGLYDADRLCHALLSLC